MMPKMPVRVKFNPAAEPWWDHRETRDFVLLWYPNHLVSQYFWLDAIAIGKTIENRKPKTARQLAGCIRGVDFLWNDIQAFVVDAIPYFNGEKQVTWELV